MDIEEKLQILNLGIARRMRRRRLMMGVSRKELAVRLSISQQQFYKYELGINRISAAFIALISDELDVPVEYFFEAIRGEDWEWEGEDRT